MSRPGIPTIRSRIPRVGLTFDLEKGYLDKILSLVLSYLIVILHRVGMISHDHIKKKLYN